MKLYPNFDDCSYDRADENGELKKRNLDIRSKAKFKQGMNMYTSMYNAVL